MPTTLNDAELLEMHATLIEWTATPNFSNAFRQRCGSTALMVAEHLAGASNEAAAAAAIEQVFGDPAHREAERLERAESLHAATDAAYQQGDLAAWKASFVRLLDTLSESHLEFIASHFAAIADSRPVHSIDPAMLQPSPAGLQ